MFKNPSRRGVTLTDTIVAAALIGTLASAVVISIRILNSLKFQDEVVDMNSQARAFLRQISHEIKNAPQIDWISNDQVRIYTYDFEQWETDDERLLDDRIDPGGGEVFNWGIIEYTIITDAHPDANLTIRGKVPDKPYLRRRLTWAYAVPAINRTAATLVTNSFKFEGIIVPSDGVDIFTFVDPTSPDRSMAGSSALQSLEITLGLLPPFRRFRNKNAASAEDQGDPLIYTALVTMRSSTEN